MGFYVLFCFLVFVFSSRIVFVRLSQDVFSVLLDQVQLTWLTRGQTGSQKIFGVFRGKLQMDCSLPTIMELDRVPQEESSKPACQTLSFGMWKEATGKKPSTEGSKTLRSKDPFGMCGRFSRTKRKGTSRVNSPDLFLEAQACGFQEPFGDVDKNPRFRGWMELKKTQSSEKNGGPSGSPGKALEALGPILVELSSSWESVLCVLCWFVFFSGMVIEKGKESQPPVPRLKCPFRGSQKAMWKPQRLPVKTPWVYAGKPPPHGPAYPIQLQTSARITPRSSRIFKRSENPMVSIYQLCHTAISESAPIIVQ